MTPQRIQLSRKKGFKLPPNTISVARPGKWGNPFKIILTMQNGTPIPPALARQVAVANFRNWVDDDYWNLAQAILRGKNLACYCPLDQACHADVLLEIANK